MSNRSKWGQIVALNIHTDLEQQIRHLFAHYPGRRYSACGVWDVDTVLLKSRHKVVATAFFDEDIKEPFREIFFTLKIKKIRRPHTWSRHFQPLAPGEVIVEFFTGGHAT